MKKIHLGRLIEKKFVESGLTKKAFAEKVGMSTRHLYTIFEKESADTAFLQRVTDVLNYNFFTEYAEVGHEPKNQKIGDQPKFNNTTVLKLEVTINAPYNKKEILASVSEQLDRFF